MLQTLIVVHVAGALILSAILFASFVDLVRNTNERLRNYAIAVAGGFFLQALTGSALALTSDAPVSVFHFCKNISAYVLPVVLMEVALLVKINQTSRSLVPVKVAVSLLGLGFCVIVLTVGALA